MEFRIISIGTLSHNDLWPGKLPPRTAHSTTTLITSGDRVVLVDPGLPPQVIVARLAERAGLTPDKITDVFLTSFRPAHRQGIAVFEQARWLIAENERETIGRAIIERYQQEQDEQARELLAADIALLKRFTNAPDKLAEHVDLFPLPGFTPGHCGLVLSHSRSTTVVAGDAVPTIEHLEHGKVLKGAYDIEQAQESLLEVVEIADQIVPGHDNVLINPGRGLGAAGHG